MESSPDSDDFQAFESYQGPNPSSIQPATKSVPHSDTADSLSDAPNAKSFTPSMASSGYGSQAVSSQTLSSEDNNSVRSLDDTPDIENRINGGAKRLSESSLIDTEVPSNLGTPLQPLSPEESASSDNSQQTVTDSKNDVQTSASTATLQDAQEIVDSVIPDGNESIVSTEQSKAEPAEQPKADVYSENALEELEALNESGDESTEESTTQKRKVNGGSTKDSTRRQSWHERRVEDTPMGTPPRTSVSGMRKSVSIDTLKSTPSFKKHHRDNGTKKATPVKATYRPMSMNLDSTMFNNSNLSLNDDDENHSGKFCFLSFKR